MKISNWVHSLDRISWLFICLNLIILFTLLIYSNSFSGSMVMDDANTIQPRLRSFIESPATQKWFGEQRVVTDLTFALNYQLHGTETFGYHLVNFVIHVLNGALVLVLVHLLFQTPALRQTKLRSSVRLIALTSALFFLSHPIQTMAVTYITQRYSSLATFWYVLTFILYLSCRLRLVAVPVKPTRATRRSQIVAAGLAIGALLSFVIGLHTKETLASLPLLILMSEWILFEARQVPWKLLGLSSVGLILVGILAMRMYPLDWIFSHQENTLGEVVTPINYALTQFRALLIYLQRIILPINLNADHYVPLSQNLWDVRVWMGITTLGLLWSGVVWWHRKSAIAAFGLSWFLIAPLASSSIIPIVDVVNEYRMYLPLIGMSLIFSFLVWQYVAQRSELIALSCITIVILGLGLLTFDRNFVYANDLTFWADVIKKSPQKARGYVNYGVGLHSRGMGQEALEYYQKALAIDPDRVTVLSNLGVLYTQAGRLDTAEEYFLQAIQADPEYVDAMNGLGVVYLNQGDLVRAEAQFSQVLEKDLDNKAALENLKRL